MSLLFMLAALVGAVFVLAGGSYALRRVIAAVAARLETGRASPSADSGVSLQVGGYVPALRAFSELPPRLREQVSDLVVSGRSEEAVRLVRDRCGGDEVRARGIVAALGGDGGAEPAPGR